MNKKLIVAALVTGIAVIGAAQARQYVDYTPENGVWEINAIEVDPNHVDDYLVGLRRSQIPVFDILKRRGVIDNYRILVRDGHVKGSPNVLIESHYPNHGMLGPEKARDQAIEREVIAQFSEEKGRAAVAGYEKYRQFVDDSYWSETTIAK
jgi:hypothetical protein